MKAETLSRLLRSRKFIGWHLPRLKRAPVRPRPHRPLPDGIKVWRQRKPVIGSIKNTVHGGSAQAQYEKHYSPSDIAAQWGVSVDLVRDTFRNEPGVLKIVRASTKYKRSYATIRIPESVLLRVHQRLTA